MPGCGASSGRNAKAHFGELVRLDGSIHLGSSATECRGHCTRTGRTCRNRKHGTDSVRGKGKDCACPPTVSIQRRWLDLRDRRAFRDAWEKSCEEAAAPNKCSGWH